MLFIGGKSDWGAYSAPGAVDLMRTKAATRMGDIELVDGAGHWIQQERPDRLSMLLLAFIKEVGGADHTGDKTGSAANGIGKTRCRG